MSALLPIDLSQCQAEKPNGVNFMTLGGRPGLVRCKDKPVYIATENRPGADGQHGTMTLCYHCAAQLVKQCGTDFATLTPIQ